MDYQPVGITAGASSYNSPPQPTLDPEIFEGTRLRPDVRMDLMALIGSFLADHGYKNSNSWLKMWIAGSGASYRWNTHAVSDLDVLLGIDAVAFRQANPNMRGMGDTEIAQQLNEELRADLWPKTALWRGHYEVTWYVNPYSQDIRSINPYAAYDVLDDGWDVRPTADATVTPPTWEGHAATVGGAAINAIKRYSQALTEVHQATNPAHRRDAQVRFQMAVDQATGLYYAIHKGRRTAFTPTGGGYSDFANYLWQTGKGAGWLEALRRISDYRTQVENANVADLYGTDLPTADTLIRRAALAYR